MKTSTVLVVAALLLFSRGGSSATTSTPAAPASTQAAPTADPFAGKNVPAVSYHQLDLGANQKAYLNALSFQDNDSAAYYLNKITHGEP